MSDTLLDQIVFVTLAYSTRGGQRARLLVDSIRSFGGALSQCPIWLFEADQPEAPGSNLAGEGIHVFRSRVPDSVGHYPFSEKVYACAQAEAMANSQVQSLVWIDPGCLVVNPPLLFSLGPASDAAVRPVHIRNIGLAPTEPLDGFWTKIYETVGVKDIQATVESFVDIQHIRAYFNSHAFAVNPSRGLLGRWFECFAALVCDEAFQSASCQDERHRIFLHQAILSAILAASLNPERIRILPPDYNYPYNLHGSVPPDRRAQALNDLVCLAYEDRSINSSVMDDINIDEPLRSWLSAHAGVNPGVG